MKKLILTSLVAAQLLVGSFQLDSLTVLAQQNEDDNGARCIDVLAPSPEVFERTVSRSGVKVTYRWFETSEGEWQLMMDMDPRGGHEYWVTEYPRIWFYMRPVRLPQTVTEMTCPTPVECGEHQYMEEDACVDKEEVCEVSDPERQIQNIGMCQPAEAPVTRDSRIEITGITCSNTNFDAKYYALENDNPVAGVKVTFEYRNIKKDAVTDANGMAVAGYSFMGVDTVFARPDGFPDQNARIDDATGCAASTTSEAPGVGGQVLGIITEQAASTHAPVLGVSTLAATGTTDDVIARTTGILGGALIMIGSYLYAKKKVSA